MVREQIGAMLLSELLDTGNEKVEELVHEIMQAVGDVTIIDTLISEIVHIRRMGREIVQLLIKE